MMEAGFALTEQNYRYLFENASDAMWVHDMEGNFLDANRAFERLSGYSLEEWAHINVTLFLNDEALALARGVQRKLLNGEEIIQPYEQRLVMKDGTVRTMKMATSLVTIDGEPRGFQHVARDITEEKQLQENMRFYVQLITKTQEEERKRVARELHDDVSPLLLLLIQRLDTIIPSNRPKQSQALREKLEILRSQAVEALEQLRRCAQDLRPRILDDLGLAAALEWMAENMEENHGIKAHVEVIGNEGGLPAEVQLLLFRIAQEALSNIRRHAKASIAAVKLEIGDDSVTMTLSDNGKGFEVPERIEDLAGIGKLGIMGMSERARLLSGTLEIKSELGKGTQVVAKLAL